MRYGGERAKIDASTSNNMHGDLHTLSMISSAHTQHMKLNADILHRSMSDGELCVGLMMKRGSVSIWNALTYDVRRGQIMGEKKAKSAVCYCFSFITNHTGAHENVSVCCARVTFAVRLKINKRGSTTLCFRK